MTTNTEPLKVGEECREAFEQWMLTTIGTIPMFDKDSARYFDSNVHQNWRTWQAAWNRRTEPSPAEVSSEGVRESDKQLLKFYDVSTLHELIDAQEKHILKLQETARRYMPQQSFVTNGGRNG